MKRILLNTLCLILILAITLPAQDTTANDTYIKAMTTTDLDQKAKLLKDWVNQYGGQGHQYENFACATLCVMQCSGKTNYDVIKYGEQALKVEGLDDLTKTNVMLRVASVYALKGQNLSKAKNYANQVIQLAKTSKTKESEAANTKTWNQLMGAGYYVQAQAMEKNNDLKNAVSAYINSYNILKTKAIITNLATLGKSLYEAKAYADAEKALKVASQVLNNFGTIKLYARSLHRGGKKSEAVKYYKQAYNKQKNGEIAYNIGILLANGAKTNGSQSSESIQYLLEASFLSPVHSKKAMKLAEGLYFSQNSEYNEKVKALQEKSKKLEQLTQTFNKTFGEKTEEELSDKEKKDMKSRLAKIESEQKAFEKIQTEQQAALEKFNNLVAQTKQKLGIN